MVKVKFSDRTTIIVIITIIVISLLIATFLSPFASSFPDGLEKVAENKGFLEKGEGEPIINAPMPDYTFSKISNEKATTAFAGISGTLLIFGLGCILGLSLRKIKKVGTHVS